YGSPFSDVREGAYYAEAVGWAAANGIVKGYGDGRFGPDDNITREQLAAILNRYEAFSGKAPAEVAAGVEFADRAEISDYAKPAASALAAQGVVEGRPGNVFDPKSEATRAEVAAVLHRFIVAVDG
ncbi:MAG: S-layer homology domain-containing protein, partial [Clostridiales Family XIII bacterium]|nr:S-layer homology domain-containing protein [Clostridiales Family XIII bacterium]